MKPAISKCNERFLATEDYLFGKAPNAFLVKQTLARLKQDMQVLAIADGE